MCVKRYYKRVKQIKDLLLGWVTAKDECGNDVTKKGDLYDEADSCDKPLCSVTFNIEKGSDYTYITPITDVENVAYTIINSNLYKEVNSSRYYISNSYLRTLDEGTYSMLKAVYMCGNEKVLDVASIKVTREEYPIAKVFSVSPTSFNFNNQKQDGNVIMVNSSSSTETIGFDTYVSVNWIRITEETQNHIKFTVLENDDYNDRRGVITLIQRGTNLKETVAVEQKGIGSHLFYSDITEVNAHINSAYYTIRVTSKVNGNVVPFRVKSSEGNFYSTRILPNNSALVIEMTDNRTLNIREGYVILEQTDYPSNTLRIDIRQDAYVPKTYVLTLSPNEFNISSDSTTLEVDIVSTIDGEDASFRISSTEEWFMPIIRTKHISIKVVKNTTSSQRVGTLTITQIDSDSKDTPMSAVITITQDAEVVPPQPTEEVLYNVNVTLGNETSNHLYSPLSFTLYGLKDNIGNQLTPTSIDDMYFTDACSKQGVDYKLIATFDDSYRQLPPYTFEEKSISKNDDSYDYVALVMSTNQTYALGISGRINELDSPRWQNWRSEGSVSHHELWFIIPTNGIYDREFDVTVNDANGVSTMNLEDEEDETTTNNDEITFIKLD